VRQHSSKHHKVNRKEDSDHLDKYGRGHEKYLGIPIGVVQDDSICTSQIDAKSTCSCGDQEDEERRFGSVVPPNVKTSLDTIR